MTRTERSFNPRAILRDRSESKSGLDKSDRKGGAGAHNWGSFADEQDHELRAVEDFEEEDFNADEGAAKAGSTASVSDSPKAARDGSLPERRFSVMSEEEKQQAWEFRAKALKDGSDLGAIARTSAAVSTSPPVKATPVAVTSDSLTSVLA